VKGARGDHDAPIPVITMRRSWRSRCADLGDHEGDPGDHDAPIWVITMRRSG
jgi:hypothetical protein